jgi:hypothetical protein
LDGVAANLGPVADFKAAQHLGTRAHHHVLAERGMAFGAFVERCSAQGHALVDGAAVADFSGLAHHHAHGVVKKHLLTDLGTGVNLNAGKPARDVRDEAPQPLEAMVPAPMRPAVQHQSVQARVAGQDFPGGTGRRVTVKNALDVGAKA